MSEAAASKYPLLDRIQTPKDLKRLRVAELPKLVAPYAARMMLTRMPLSNAKAKTELGWRPAYPTVRDGLLRMFRS